MKNIYALLSMLLSSTLTVGCGGVQADNAEAENTGELLSVQELFSERDMEGTWDETTAATIELDGQSASSDSPSVSISGGNITISDEGTYVVSGTLEDGTIIVDSEKTDKIQLVLNNASITSQTSAPIYVKQADKVFLTLADSSENILSNGGSYVQTDDDNIDAAIFAKDDLTINGSGTLTINGGEMHAVAAKDELTITGGNYRITAAEHGLSAKDSVCIAGGTFEINSGKDGIHADNDEDENLGFVYISDGQFTITSGGDGISASGVLQADGASYSIVSGGGSANTQAVVGSGNFGGRPGGGNRQPGAPGNESVSAPPENSSKPIATSPENTGEENPRPQDDIAAGADEDISISSQETESEDVSAKGLKADGKLIINSGSYTVDSSDDTIHSNSDITINDGAFELSSGDDGIHSDTAVTIGGGTINISTCYEGMEGQTVAIKGGDITIISSDDGLNAAGGNDGSGFGGGRDAFAADENAEVSISGGKLTITAGGDGIDSNGALTVSGGETYISGPDNGGNSSLDYAGEAIITGDIFAAAGSAQMAENFGESSTQGAMLITVSRQQTGSSVRLLDAEGNALISFAPQKDYDSLLLSCPQITQGSAYTVTAGDITTEVVMDSLVYGEGAGGFGMRGGRNTSPRDMEGNEGETKRQYRPEGGRDMLPAAVPPEADNANASTSVN